MRSALDASSFNWSVVPGPVVIHIGAADGPHAVAGEIWLDAGLLDSGRFSWGVDPARVRAPGRLRAPDGSDAHDASTALLGGSSWWGRRARPLDCERFADAVAWAYWPSPDNVLRPDRPAGRASFRAALALLLPGRLREVDRLRRPKAARPERVRADTAGC